MCVCVCVCSMFYISLGVAGRGGVGQDIMKTYLISPLAPCSGPWPGPKLPCVSSFYPFPLFSLCSVLDPYVIIVPYGTSHRIIDLEGSKIRNSARKDQKWPLLGPKSIFKDFWTKRLAIFEHLSLPQNG